MKIIKRKKGDQITLEPVGSWPATMHEFEEDSIWAVNAALATGRPLLIRGLPGTGKSQLARAVAQELGRIFLYQVVNAQTTAQDLQYYDDAVSRLGNAQTLAGVTDTSDIKRRLDPVRYLSPGILWWAFGWNSALEIYGKGTKVLSKPITSEGWQPEQGAVLLIDEIDKADADLPNGLLEILGNGAFSIPYLGEPIRVDQAGTQPLVIISTNEERELPPAFLRRCLVLHLELPRDPDELTRWLIRRGKVHHGDMDTNVMETAAQLTVDAVGQARNEGLPQPGQAEFLDLLRALERLGGDSEDQSRVLDKISQFALKKKQMEY